MACWQISVNGMAKRQWRGGGSENKRHGGKSVIADRRT